MRDWATPRINPWGSNLLRKFRIPYLFSSRRYANETLRERGSDSSRTIGLRKIYSFPLWRIGDFELVPVLADLWMLRLNQAFRHDCSTFS